MSAVFNEARKDDFEAFYNIGTAILPWFHKYIRKSDHLCLSWLVNPRVIFQKFGKYEQK